MLTDRSIVLFTYKQTREDCMQRIKDVQLSGQAFRLIDSVHVHITVDTWHPLFGLKALNLEFGTLSCFTGEEEIELVTLLPIALEQEDLENLDQILLLEGEGETRASRVSRMIEGGDGAIASELSRHKMYNGLIDQHDLYAAFTDFVCAFEVPA
jgi:hypothetical protein